LAVRDPGFREVWQKLKEGAGRAVQSPVFQAVGSAVAGAAIDKGVNSVFSGRRHRRRSLEVLFTHLFDTFFVVSRLTLTTRSRSPSSMHASLVLLTACQRSLQGPWKSIPNSKRGSGKWTCWTNSAV
jgi:hypothetical protein